MPSISWCAPHRLRPARRPLHLSRVLWQMQNHITQGMRTRWQPSVKVFRAILRGQKVNHQQEGEQIAWQAFAGHVAAAP